MMKKIYLRLLAGLLSAALLLISVGCSAGQTGNDEPEVPLSKVRICDYTIVRGDDSGNAVLKQVLVLRDAIENRFDQAPEMSTDWNALVNESDAKDPSSACEILVGLTNRAESEAVNDELVGKYGYIYRTVGNKIVITATTVALLEEAVKHFVDKYLVRSHNGYLPSVIDCVYIEKDQLYFNTLESNEMVLYLPINASPALQETAVRFASAMLKMTGITVLTERTRLLDHTAVFALSKERFPAVRMFKGEGWGIHADVDTVSLVLQGEDETALMYAIADLYDYFGQYGTTLLTGETQLHFFSNRALSEIDSPFFPSVMGGNYIGGEQVSAGSSVYYFENVTNEEFVWYQSFLTGSCGYKQLYTERFTDYQNAGGTVTLTLTHDVDKQILSVIAHGVEK